MPMIQPRGLSQALIGAGLGAITTVIPMGLLLSLTRSTATDSSSSSSNAGQVSGLLLALTQAGGSSSSSHAGELSGLSLALTRAS